MAEPRTGSRRSLKRPLKGLNTGDTVEFSISQEFPSRGTTTWLKCGATTKVQPGETADLATRRLAGFVMDMLEAQVAELLQE